MATKNLAQNLARIDSVIEPILSAAKLPGAAIAVVADGEMAFAKGYGYRDLAAKLPMQADTIYPIASTTKAINATLLGMLVDEGRLAWDVPVRNYVPGFRLYDPVASEKATLRDLLAMRTGLPRHDWMWIDNPVSRNEIVERLRFLEPSAGFRERFQYNNLTSTTAGYIAEVVTGERWDDLVRSRICQPLGMNATQFALPATGPVTRCYQEDPNGKIIPSEFSYAIENTTPSGGSIHSTVEDMAKWIGFNLNEGAVDGKALIKPDTLKELHSPWMVVGNVPESVSPNCTYGGGWIMDTYNGRPRVSHGGYLDDITSDVALFPSDGIGVVCFSNFGFPRFPRFINEHVFDLLMDFTSAQSLDDKIAQLQKKRDEHREKLASARRVAGTSPSHALNYYTGTYVHPAYGAVAIGLQGNELVFKRNKFVLPLEHWHYDVWFAKESNLFTTHEPNPFDRANRLQFMTNIDGEIAALAIRLEPALAPIQFKKE